MPPAYVGFVRNRANWRCEYCLLPSAFYPLRFQIDHIIVKQHGGGDDLDNLALSCTHYNLYKGPNIAGIDPQTGLLTRLFNPRSDEWTIHFSWKENRLIPLSSVGRATVSVLDMNDPEIVLLRAALALEQDR